MAESDDYAAMEAAAQALVSMRHQALPRGCQPEWWAYISSGEYYSSRGGGGGGADLFAELRELAVMRCPKQRRSQRTRSRFAKRREVAPAAAAAASVGVMCAGEKVVRRKRSPGTPLEFSGGSGESTSFGEDGVDAGMSFVPKRRRNTAVKPEPETAAAGSGCGVDEGTSQPKPPPTRPRIRFVGLGFGERKAQVGSNQETKFPSRPGTGLSIASAKPDAKFELAAAASSRPSSRKQPVEHTFQAPAPSAPSPSESKQGGGFLLPDLNLPIDDAAAFC